jgi:hypothetical protein
MIGYRKALSQQPAATSSFTTVLNVVLLSLVRVGAPSSLPWQSQRWRASFAPDEIPAATLRSPGGKEFAAGRHMLGIEHLELYHSSLTV